MSEVRRHADPRGQPWRPIERVRWARLLARENGIRWTAYATMFSVVKLATRLIEGRMTRLEKKHGLGGRTAVAVNYDYWQRWDWSSAGEEWTLSEEWKQSLIDDVMLRHVKPRTTVLEIGPGAGRWTAALQPVAGHLIVVDLSDRCIDICRQRFAGATNMEFHVNDGESLAAVNNGSVDVVWSFDVFVHIAVPAIDAYVLEIARVLRPGGRAVIHHAAAGDEDEAQQVGMRSRMTREMFAAMAQSAGLTVVEQFDSWGRDGRFKVPQKWDAVSVIEKKA